MGGKWKRGRRWKERVVGEEGGEQEKRDEKTEGGKGGV